MGLKQGNQVLAVHPVPEYFAITWQLGTLCNYDCMYCPNEWHDDSSRPHDLDRLQASWFNIYQQTHDQGLPYKISFTGGEVTANRSFLPFVKWLRDSCDQIKMILITTNGSASLRYYCELTKHIEAISFSTHSEFMDEADFFQKVQTLDKMMIRPAKSLHVNIMDEPWNRERIALYQGFCQQHGIIHSVNRINMSLRTRDEPIKIAEQSLERIWQPS